MTGADALDLDTLAGALLAAVKDASTTATQEAWRREGAQFFLSHRRKSRTGGAHATDGDRDRLEAGGVGDPQG